MNSDIEIRVDPTNPGEFFACCGLLELADRLSAGAEGWFDLEPDRFFVSFSNPSGGVTILEILRALADTPVEPESDDDDKLSPLFLGEPLDIRLDWWLNPDGSKSMLKGWAGQQNSTKMFSKWKEPLKQILSDENPDPTALFQRQTQLQGPYGFDPKFSWDALSVGFSLNDHRQYKKSLARPVVEILGAVGIQRFALDIDRGEGVIRYAAWKAPLSPSVARLASVGKLPHATLLKLESKTTRRGSYKGFDTARMQTGDFDD